MASLRFILRLNSVSCLGFGLLFVAGPEMISAFLGAMPAATLQLVGAVLIVNGGHLVLASLRRVVKPWEVIWFSIGDMSWWTVSLGLVATDTWITTGAGVAATWLVGLSVAVLGLSQLWLLGWQKSGLRNGAYWRQMGRSWSALPQWVKIWLFALNFIFLYAATLLPSDVARTTLIAYVCSGPLVLSFVFVEGGLSRASGIGHFVPWFPLMGWLGMWLRQQPWGSSETGYAAALLVFVGICLAFDLYDLWRWLRGERAVIGLDRASVTVPQD